MVLPVDPQGSPKWFIKIKSLLNDMVYLPVKCPQCGTIFKIPSNLDQGMCPHCSAALLYEKIMVTKGQDKNMAYLEKEIDGSTLRETIDGAIEEKSTTIHLPQIQDIAVISLLSSPKQYSPIEKSVDKSGSRRYFVILKIVFFFILEQSSHIAATTSADFQCILR